MAIPMQTDREVYRQIAERFGGRVPSTFTTPVILDESPTIQPLPLEPLTVITVPADMSPRDVEQLQQDVLEQFKKWNMGHCLVVTDGISVERIDAPLLQLEAGRDANINFCPSCHEYQRPTPSGHCPGCGAGMAG
jgi:hypothetical protein